MAEVAEQLHVDPDALLEMSNDAVHMNRNVPETISRPALGEISGNGQFGQSLIVAKTMETPKQAKRCRKKMESVTEGEFQIGTSEDNGDDSTQSNTTKSLDNDDDSSDAETTVHDGMSLSLLPRVANMRLGLRAI